VSFPRKIDQQVAPELELHIICDNYSTRKHAKGHRLAQSLSPLSHPFYSHPFLLAQSGRTLLWRNHSQVIRPGAFAAVGALVVDIFRFLDQHNLNPKPYRWTADPKRILEKLDRAWKAMLEEITILFMGHHPSQSVANLLPA
jgi:hypothetical protein